MAEGAGTRGKAFFERSFVFEDETLELTLCGCGCVEGLDIQLAKALDVNWTTVLTARCPR